MQLTFENYNYDPSWSPDGEYIILNQPFQILESLIVWDITLKIIIQLSMQVILPVGLLMVKNCIYFYIK